jgi:hypothetical protein
MKIIKTTLILLAIGLLGLIGFYILRNTLRPARYLKLYTWMRDPQAHADWTIKPGQHCGDAPFVMPTTGIVGYIWGDTFKIGHRHEGIDIFGGTQAGVTPVYAAYDGYLTRESTWKSAVIIRIPNDRCSPAARFGSITRTWRIRMANRLFRRLSRPIRMKCSSRPALSGLPGQLFRHAQQSGRCAPPLFRGQG